jgi:uncharacterized protein
MLTKTIPLARVKAGPEDGLAEGQFIVYPSTFTREPDSYGDVVAKGAFADTITRWKDSGNVLPGLYGHRMDDPDYYVAAADDMGEDDHGFWVKGTFDLESPKGKQVYRLVKGRRLTQMSFAFDPVEQATVELEDGREANELRAVNLYEFSFVPVGANQDTSVVAVKTQAEVLVEQVKAGRVLSSKNLASLRSAQEAIGTVIADATADGSDEEGKASLVAPPNSEEPHGVNEEEAAHSRSVKARALLLITEAL